MVPETKNQTRNADDGPAAENSASEEAVDEAPQAEVHGEANQAGTPSTETEEVRITNARARDQSLLFAILTILHTVLAAARCRSPSPYIRCG